MSAITRAEVIQSTGGFGTAHTFDFTGGACAANSTLILLLLNTATAITSVTGIGDTGTFNLDVTTSTGRAWSLDTGASTAFTGILVTTTSSESDFAGGLIVEATGLASSSTYDVSGVMTSVFGETNLSAPTASATTTTDGLICSLFTSADIANVSSTNSGYTNYGLSTTFIGQTNPLPGAPAVETAGLVLSTNPNTTGGIVVAYKAAAGGGAPVLSLPTVTSITDTTATPRVTITI